MIKIKTCKRCGRRFEVKGRNQKYCSISCRELAYIQSQAYKAKRNVKIRKDEQPCWHCAKATGGCSWSRSFKPVDGWKAKKTIIMNGIEIIDKQPRICHSYKIESCPEFIYG